MAKKTNKPIVDPAKTEALVAAQNKAIQELAKAGKYDIKNKIAAVKAVRSSS